MKRHLDDVLLAGQCWPDTGWKYFVLVQGGRGWNPYHNSYENINPMNKAGHHWPVSKTPFKWRFAGGPMMDWHWLGKLYDFPGREWGMKFIPEFLKGLTALWFSRGRPDPYGSAHWTAFCHPQQDGNYNWLGLQSVWRCRMRYHILWKLPACIVSWRHNTKIKHPTHRHPRLLGVSFNRQLSIWFRYFPSRHIYILTQHRFNIDSTPWCRINVESILRQQCVPAGFSQ